MSKAHHGRQNSGASTLSWRYACPAARHQGVRRRSDGIYCQSCDRRFQQVIDLRDDVAIPVEETTS